MRSLLLWILTSVFFQISFSQEQTVFQKEDLHLIIPAVERFYNLKISYVNDNIEGKKASVLLDKMVSVEDFIQSLSSQTKLKFELLDEQNMVISKYQKDDLISICGQLLKENEAIENATIKIGRQYYSSDNSGSFRIDNIPFNSDIIISSFGIKKTRLKAENYLYPNCKTIEVLEKKELLDQVVIEDYLANGISKNVKQTTINRKRLKILPGLVEPDVLESIHLIPGVSNINETANSIYVRGGNSDQNLVLWNKIKVYNNSHLFGMISAFNPYVIDKVNFINKGTDAKYGERVSSVIEMESNYKPSENVRGGAGFNMLHADAFVDLPIIKNKFSVQLSGRRSYSNLVETFTFKKLAERVFQNTKISNNELNFSESKNIFWFSDFTINSAWKASNKDLVKFNFLHNQNHLNFSAFNNDKSNLYVDELNAGNNGYNIEWEREWLPNLSHQIDMYSSNYKLDYRFSDQSNIGVLANSKENEIKDKGVNLNLKYELDSYKELNLGYQFTSKKVGYSFKEESLNLLSTLDAASTNTEANSLYLTYQVNKPNNFLFLAGLRANKYNISKEFLVEPRAILQKFVTNEFSINSSVEYRSQFISQIQESVVSNLSLENHVWALSRNSSIPILKSYQYTIGANYSKNKWILDLEAYFKRTKGLSSRSVDLNNPIFFEYNEGSFKYSRDRFLYKETI